ncbi:MULTISPECIES: hypothetical protein [unclassified Lysinibacillus]|uniref:hypothetical protein n=1 Tax=unclassified Lysinibacillus TaxID=2636778 RepID=UPI00131EE632|nr:MULTISPECIES: hypothetical protein [unclassified Lysinibacillus]
MQNSERFLTAFNRIDHTMRELTHVKYFLAFNRALLITEHGHPHEKLIGIVTPIAL